jgi:hypothetical protein
VVSLLGVGGVETTRLSEGAVARLVVEAFCATCLRPCLKAGDVLGVDNLEAHRASRIEEPARGCKASVIGLPP